MWKNHSPWWSAAVSNSKFDAESFLSRLALLKHASKLLALVFVQNLLDSRPTVREYGAVVLPEVVKHGLHLLGLGGREVEVALHALEIQSFAGGSTETRLVQARVNPEIHGDCSGCGAAQKDQGQGYGTDNSRVPGPREGDPLQDLRAHRSSS